MALSCHVMSWLSEWRGVLRRQLGEYDSVQLFDYMADFGEEK